MSFWKTLSKELHARKKKTVAVSIDEDLLKWIDEQIEIKRFTHRSHAFEYAIEQLRRTSL